MCACTSCAQPDAATVVVAPWTPLSHNNQPNADLGSPHALCQVNCDPSNVNVFTPVLGIRWLSQLHLEDEARSKKEPSHSREYLYLVERLTIVLLNSMTLLPLIPLESGYSSHTGSKPYPLFT